MPQHPARFPCKFGVVREDPELEAALVERAGASAALVVASGGCTALTLAARFPALAVTAFDRSPAQLAQLRARAAAARASDREALARLDEAGEFEALFRQHRGFLAELVTSTDELEGFFRADAPQRAALLARWRASPYWPVAFQLFFHDALLRAMFGPDATRHAAPGSYPDYFRRAYERGLERDDAAANPWLQHLLLGRRLAPPTYLGLAREVELTQGTLEEVPDPARFQLVSLSNIFDWSDDALVAAWARHLRALPRGAAVLVRQLNNARAVERAFAPDFALDAALGAELLRRDRSLFYERVLVAFRS